LEVHQGMDRNNKVVWYTSSYNANNISLNIPVFMSGHLLCFQDPIMKMSETSMWMKDREMEINLVLAKCLDAPLRIVVPELFVPIMEWLRRETSQ
jgi:hypothetical protein